jgi:NADH-quinone oxidoreductase subunit J
VTVLFFIAATVAVVATFMVITRANAMHALLYLVVSLLAVAMVFYVLGAPFIAALEVIIYAGAIMVLFLFALMLLNLGPEEEAEERQWMRLRSWLFPSLLVVILLGELLYLLASDGLPGGAGNAPGPQGVVEVKAVGVALFGSYLLAIELASVLLLAGLVAAHRLTRNDPEPSDLAEEGE